MQKKTENKFYGRKSNCSLPLDQSTVKGYLVETVHMLIAGDVYFVMNGVTLVLFISICIHHGAFYKIFNRLIDEWNFCDANHHLVDTMFIRNLVRFHVSVKE